MLHKVALFGITALVGGFVAGSAGVAMAQTVDATHYTITCDTLSKGTIGFKPSLLIPGGTVPLESTKIKGTRVLASLQRQQTANEVTQAFDERMADSASSTEPP